MENSIKKIYQENKAMTIVWCSAVLLVLIALAVRPVNQKENTPEGKFIAAMMDEQNAIDKAIESEVKLRLKYPEEADFLKKDGFSIVDLSHNKGGTSGDVVSKNGFGVKVRMHYQAVFSLDGDNVAIDRVNITE